MAIIELGDLPSDVQAHELVQVLLDGANAKALRVAPCLASTDPVPTAEQLAEARLILIGAIRRWSEAGSGAYQAQTAGPFGVTLDTRQRGGYSLWPSEIEALQDICQAGRGGRAFEVDTMPTDAGVYGVDYWWQTPTDRAAF